MKILAISGSLRKLSLNSMLLRAMSRLAPSNIKINVYSGLGDLPLFNPDIEASDPKVVADLRMRIINADAVIIASPEYAHGVTGAMKNALDWMVGCEAFLNKPVALLNASPRAIHAYGSLLETLTVMSSRVIDDACITLPIVGHKLNEDEIVTHLELSQIIHSVINSLHDAVYRPVE
jgi:chromate reductase